MIRKQHKTLTGETGASFSDCLKYRYTLWRQWAAGPLVNFIMLNPSTADEAANDPTIERCQRRATALGYGGLIVTNLFAYRATNPKVLRGLALVAVQEPQTDANDCAIKESAAQAKLVICGWGNDGRLFGRANVVLDILRGFCPWKLHALIVTGAGEPGHPLYVGYDRKPFALPALSEQPMSNQDNWIPTAQRLPIKGSKVEWISPGGMHERGTYAGGVIWFPENSPMYYTPQFWRPIEAGAK